MSIDDIRDDLRPAPDRLGVMLLLGTAIERGIGHRGLNILSKLTGIILAALAAQMIMDGILGFIAGKAA